MDLRTEFQEAALRFIDPEVIRSGKPLKVVVDGGNGMAGPMVGPLLEGLGLDLVETYWTPDGNFPDHEPNPLLEENRQFIIEQVREQGADLGIAWDGDADRCFFIDDTGEFVDGDFLTALLAESLLRTAPRRGDPVRRARLAGGPGHRRRRPAGSAFVNRVGHAFFKTRMRKEGSLFGGEVSGHYYFRDFYCADSGTLPALLMLELLAREGRVAVEPARALPRALLHLRRDQLARSQTRPRRSRSSPSATPTRARTASTASRSTTTTGTSTCGPRTPSRCCACAWSRWSRPRTWNAAATRCSP